QLYESLSAWIASVRAGAGGGVPENVKKIVALEKAKRSESQSSELRAYFVEHAYTKTAELLAPLGAKIEQAQRRRKELEEQTATTVVFGERGGEPKPAYLLKRGEYDQRGEKVERGVPASLPPLPPAAPMNRLGLAQWLVAPNHPLTARVAV